MERAFLSESSSRSSSNNTRLHDHSGSSVRLRANSRADIHVLEQLKVQRRNMTQVCKMCVKSLVDKSPFETITDDCPHLNNLCNVLEHIFLHRMQARWSIFSTTDPVHYWHIIQQYASSVTVGSIDDMENVSTELGKCRAWLRLSLVQKRLATFMDILVSKQHELKVAYMQGALMISAELQEVAGVLKCLDAIDFNLCLRDQDFDYYDKLEIDYSPYLVFHQNTSSRRDDRQEERRLLSTSSSIDSRGINEEREEEKEEEEEVTSLKELLKVEREQKNYYEELVSVRDTQINQLQRELDSLGRESEKEKKEMSGIIIELQDQISKLQDNIRQQQKAGRRTNDNRRSGLFSSIFKSGDED